MKSLLSLLICPCFCWPMCEKKLLGQCVSITYCAFHYSAWLKIHVERTWKPFCVLFRHSLWMLHSWIGIKAWRWKASKLLAVWKLNAGRFLKGLFSICRPEVHVWVAEVSQTLDWERSFFFLFFPPPPIWEHDSLLICPGLRWLKVVCAFVETLAARDSSLCCVVCWTMSSGLDTSLRRLCVVLSSHKHMT